MENDAEGGQEFPVECGVAGLSRRQLGGEESDSLKEKKASGGQLALCSCWRTAPTRMFEASTARERTTFGLG
jgi:hypothetical protein